MLIFPHVNVSNFQYLSVEYYSSFFEKISFYSCCGVGIDCSGEMLLELIGITFNSAKVS